MTAAGPQAPTREQLAGQVCICCGVPGGRLVSAGERPVYARSGSSVAGTYQVRAHATCLGGVG